MTRPLTLAVLSLAGASPGAFADYNVEMNAIDIRGVGASLGFVAVGAARSGGVVFAPNLHGLPPGVHGFHVHEFANCGAREKDGRMSPGERAGEHFDPKKTKHHGGAGGNGHLGDLPPLEVGADGTATRSVTSARLTLKDLKNKALVIHQGGDNGTDNPPNGGGGARIACGVVEPGPQ